MPDRRGAAGGNPALHILFTNELTGLQVAQSHTYGHKPWTDRMTSGIMLSTVDIASLYPRRSPLVSPS